MISNIKKAVKKNRGYLGFRGFKKFDHTKLAYINKEIAMFNEFINGFEKSAGAGTGAVLGDLIAGPIGAAAGGALGAKKGEQGRAAGGGALGSFGGRSAGLLAGGGAGYYGSKLLNKKRAGQVLKKGLFGGYTRGGRAGMIGGIGGAMLGGALGAGFGARKAVESGRK